MIAVSIEKKKLYQERARQKEIERRSSTEYKEKVFKQAKAAQERSLTKQREKQKLSVFDNAKPKNTNNARKAFSGAKPGLINQASKPTKPRKQIKSKGLTGVSRTKAEVELHDKMAELGCICCIKKGLIQAFSQPFAGARVSIHHMRGRTKANCHKYALPLCEWHHDTPIEKDNPLYIELTDVFPIHAKGAIGGRVPWEKENGTQEELLIEVLSMIGEQALIVELGLQPLTVVQ